MVALGRIDSLLNDLERKDQEQDLLNTKNWSGRRISYCCMQGLCTCESAVAPAKRKAAAE